MDVPSLPSFVDDGAGDAAAAAIPEVLTADAAAYLESIGVRVPPDATVPLHERWRNDALSVPEHAPERASVIVGQAHRVPWVLVVPWTDSGAARALHALVHNTLHGPVDHELNQWDSTSVVSQRNAGQVTASSPLLESSLELAEALRVASGGLFDVRTAAMRDEWLRCLRQGLTPTAVAMAELRGRLEAGEGPVDLAAISKGVGVDQVAHALLECGQAAFLFDWGGEMCARGAHPSGRPWRTSVLQVRMAVRPHVCMCDLHIAQHAQPPSLRALFRAWGSQTRAVVDASRPVAVVDLCPSSASGCVFVSTSGDYFSSLKHGYFPLCTPNGLLLQASAHSVASVTVVSTHSAAAADGVATAALLHQGPAHALAFLRRHGPSFGVAQYWVVSRSGWVSHASPDELAAPPVAAPRAALRLSDSLLARLDATHELHKRGAPPWIGTARIASLQPALCTVLLSEGADAMPKAFALPGGEQCTVLHQSRALLIASVSTDGAVQLRRRLATTFVARVALEDAGGVVLPQCTSLAWTPQLVSFNVEVGSAMGVLLGARGEGRVRIEAESVGLAVVCPIVEVATVGDHLVVVCCVEREQ